MSDFEPETPEQGTLSEPDAAPAPAAEEGGEAQPRDEAGRFAPKDPRAAQVLDKYDGDLDKALSAAADAQELIGRQGSELGELRQYRDQVEQQSSQYTPDQIAAYSEQDPAQAALLAYNQYGRGSVPYEQAIRSWGEIDPFTAARFDNQTAVNDYDRQIRPQMQQAELESGLNQIIAKYPDFPEYGDAILREAQSSPVVRALQQQGAPIGADVIEHLYLAARGRQQVAASQTQSHDATYARQQKLAGGVASATAARPDEPPPMDEEDAFKAEYQRVAREMGLMPNE
jgi:hypothetical protein